MKHLLIILLLFTGPAVQPQRKYAGKLKPVAAKLASKGDSNIVYAKPEIAAQFNGSFRGFLEKNLIYPSDSASVTDCMGTTIMQFIVERNGTIQTGSINVAPGSPVKCAAIIDEMRRIILKSSGKWKPGLVNGKPVRSLHQQTINICGAAEE